MFDMCSSYCENFIYISLSIAMWHGIFQNWRITKMPFQRKRFLKTLHKKTGALNSSFSREKSTLAEQYLAWTTVWIIKRWIRTSKEQFRKSKTTHKRVKLPNYPLQRQSHPFEQMEQSACSLKKQYNIFWCCKKSKFIILLIFVHISRVVVTL